MNATYERADKKKAGRWNSGLLGVLSLSLVMMLGGLTGCERQADKQRREVAEAQQREVERLKKELAEKEEANRKAYDTPEQKAKVSEAFRGWAEGREKEWREKKAVAIAVVQGKQPPPVGTVIREVVTQPSEVVNGACPAYDNLKIGTRFRVTAELSRKYGLTESFYELDGSCRPVLIEDDAQRRQQKEREAKRCAAPFYGFYAGDWITVEKNEQQFFGYPPGIYKLGERCVPGLVGDKKQFPAQVRKDAYKEADERLAALRTVYAETASARQSKAKEEGRLEALPARSCPPPHQRTGPGQIVVVTNAENSNTLVPMGGWWFDIDCKPHWYAPIKVVEPADVAVERSEAFWEKMVNKIILGIMVVIALLVAVHLVAVKMTGRGLIGWLRSGKKKA